MGTFGSAAVCLDEEEGEEEEKRRREVERLPPLLEDEVRLMDRHVIDNILMINTVNIHTHIAIIYFIYRLFYIYIYILKFYT